MLDYLIKSSACLAVFMLFYKLFLEKENMHTFKRFYLLASLLVSIGIPFITYTQFVEVPVEMTDLVISNSATNPLTTQTESINYYPYILWSIYVLGVVVFSLKFSFNLTNISLKIKRNPKLKTQKSIHVLLEELIVPHTFLSYIFLNKTHFETQQIPAEVLIHEEAHVIQKHSYDILFIELFQIIFWFNPLIYLLKKSIKLNHEFLADREVINKGITLSKYQQILLAFSSNALEPQLATAINYSSIKKRFTVMKTPSSKTGIWLRSIVLLPLLAILIYSFSTKEVIQKETESNSEITKEIQQLTVTINGIPCEGCTVNLSKEASEKLILGTNTNEDVTSFKIKFIGKPTVSVEGNKLNKEAIALVNENEPNKMIQIFSIKTTNSSIRMPVLIQMVDKNDKSYSNSPIVKKGEESLIPPPAPPKAPEMKMAHDLPPPPPIPDDATPEEKVKYQKIIDEYNEKHSKMVKKGDISNTPPPPLPKSPLDFVIDMAKKDATFYFGGKQISSDQAIKMLKENTSLNISAKNSSSKNPKIYLSKEPITID